MAVVQTLIGNIKGPQGDTGATGPQGAKGDAATVNVGSVSTTAYGNAAQVTNSGTENDAIFDFVIPQGKPGDKTTTMGGLTLDTITTSTAEFPSPAVGDTGATAFGKIVKFFADALSAIQSKLDANKVVNNLTTTEAGYALDARQGKELNDSLSTINSALDSKLDANKLVLSNIASFRPGIVYEGSTVNRIEFTMPFSSGSYFVLKVFASNTKMIALDYYSATGSYTRYWSGTLN